MMSVTCFLTVRKWCPFIETKKVWQNVHCLLNLGWGHRDFIVIYFSDSFEWENFSNKSKWKKRKWYLLKEAKWEMTQGTLFSLARVAKAEHGAEGPPLAEKARLLPDPFPPTSSLLGRQRFLHTVHRHHILRALWDIFFRCSLERAAFGSMF